MNDTASTQPLRLTYLVSHPIQYQAPLLRRIAADPDIALTVLFETLVTADTYRDDGFGHDVSWDVPMTEGYTHHGIADKQALEPWVARSDVLWLHGWDSHLRRQALAMGSRAGVPVLMRGENTDAAMPDGAGLRGMVKRHYLKQIFRHCRGFLCIGADNRRYYQNHGVAEGRLFNMAYTVDNEFFWARAQAAAARRDDFRRELALPDGPVVLFAGKLQSRKHPVTLLRAWQRMERTARTGCLVYVGDGEERAELESLADGDATVRILGFRNQTELPAFYELADLFALPAAREPWGLAVNEAMACGAAVLVSDQCGCAADLVGADCGLEIPAGDEAALAVALGNLLADPAKLSAMGAAARKRIDTWNFDTSIDGLKAALTAVCPKPRST